jgi:hypothetical protein
MKNETPWRDPIVEEIHQHWDEYAKKFDYDLEKIYLDLRRQQEEGPGGPIVSFASKTPTATNPPTAPARPSKRRGT